MDEMFRMLGREREADLEREALKWERAALLSARRSMSAKAVHLLRRRRIVSGFQRLARDFAGHRHAPWSS